jgi:phosphoribosylformimino-5-aminoimidazole carboxamide ribotide isomerase
MKWLSEYGPEKIILGADYRNRKISASGWLEDSRTDLVDFIEDYVSKGVRYTVCTDIDRDGTLGGPATGMYREILDRLDVKLIASGGIASMEDLTSLKMTGCEGAIVGKAFYEGRVTLKELAEIC